MITWLQLKTEVETYLDVDARRRGIEPLREAAMQGCARDLKFYLPDWFEDHHAANYVNTDLVKFTPESAEAFAEWTKERVCRQILKDHTGAREHERKYKIARQRLYLKDHELEDADETIVVKQGNTFRYEMWLDRDGIPLSLTGCTVVFQLWRRGCQDEPALELTAGSGLTILEALEGHILLEATATQMAELCGEYLWALEVTSGANVLELPDDGPGKLTVTKQLMPAAIVP